MKERCTNPNNDAYADYGGRGIKVCASWSASFETFLRDMGPRPSIAHSLDRVDNNRGYEPGNVVWATRVAQARNQRSNRVVVYRGQSMSLAEAAELAQLPYATIWSRLERGWSIDRALETFNANRLITGR